MCTMLCTYLPTTNQVTQGWSRQPYLPIWVGCTHGCLNPRAWLPAWCGSAATMEFPLDPGDMYVPWCAWCLDCVYAVVFLTDHIATACQYLVMWCDVERLDSSLVHDDADSLQVHQAPSPTRSLWQAGSARKLQKVKVGWIMKNLRTLMGYMRVWRIIDWQWRDSEPAVSAESTGKMDPQAPRWTQKYVSNTSIDELFSHFVQISET